MSDLEQLPDGLLANVKNYLDITWNDEATDRKVAGFITSGIRYLEGKAGNKLDFSLPGDARTLLFEYIRYARDGAMDVFENNYRHLILAMQHERRLDAYGSEPLSP